MSPYVCDCTNVVYMFCVYCIYYYVNKFEARSLFSTSHLECSEEACGYGCGCASGEVDCPSVVLLGSQFLGSAHILSGRF